ncbi:MAG: hypothetical protein ACRD0P_19540, partial [Stackebrandtia sp.]
MKPSPPALSEAIRAPTRHVTTRVRLWLDGPDAAPVDISSYVASVSASRELSGQLPEEVRLVEGAGTAKADLTLTGTGSLSAAQVWARDTHVGPFAGRERLGAPVTIDIGLHTAAGPLYTRVFTGYVRGVTIDGRDATLTALDARDHARTPVTFPPVAAAFSGLTVHWAVAYAAHAAGFDSQPSPARLHP